jgi:hypothetical protein
MLALADRVFALERGAVFHQGPAAPLLTDLDYRKKIVVVTERDCLRQTRSVCAREQSDEAIHSFFARRDGLLRGACHRARIRATRWLAMTGLMVQVSNARPAGCAR